MVLILLVNLEKMILILTNPILLRYLLNLRRQIMTHWLTLKWWFIFWIKVIQTKTAKLLLENEQTRAIPHSLAPKNWWTRHLRETRSSNLIESLVIDSFKNRNLHLYSFTTYEINMIIWFSNNNFLSLKILFWVKITLITNIIKFVLTAAMR